MYESLKQVDSVIKELEEKIREVRKEYEKNGQAVLKEAFGEFFNLVPEVDAVCWTQYTPFFNDGEPCEFTVYDFSLRFKNPDLRNSSTRKLNCDKEGFYDTARDFGSYVQDGRSYKYIPYEDTAYTAVGEEAFKQLKEFKCLLSEPLLESSFGDHVKVIATRDGFEVHEYDHD